MPHNLDHEAGLINLTMSYRLDADILFPYGEVLDQETENVLAPAKNIQWKQPENDYKGKKKL